MGIKILVVDDSRTDMAIVKNILSDYDLLYAHDGKEAMSIIKKDPYVDLLILDLNMPKMDGFEVLEAIQRDANYKKLTIIILTNYEDIENEIRGLDLGATDYIRKPINIGSLRKRIEVHTNLINARKELEETIRNRTKELVLTRDMTIHALVGLLEVRNIESSNHAKRTQWMIKALCEHMRYRDKYIYILTDSFIEELFSTAPLHDIGKVGIPDCILLKPDKLTNAEFEIMKRHTTYGVNALKYESDASTTISFIDAAIEIIGTHHEKFDGSGYPNGLKGEAIPLSGRIMAIVDVYDALVNKRIYKSAFNHEDALKIIAKEKGKHFDPDIVDAFLDIEKTIKDIACKYFQH